LRFIESRFPLLAGAAAALPDPDEPELLDVVEEPAAVFSAAGPCDPAPVAAIPADESEKANNATNDKVQNQRITNFYPLNDRRLKEATT
jgi:hypothetical protein